MGFAVKLVLMFFSCLSLSTADIHTLQYFYTATSGISDLAKFISVGKVDGIDFYHYDGSKQMKVPRPVWTENLDKYYWKSETELAKVYEQIFQLDIEILMERFNQTGGVHVLQKTYGCQWDDETQATDGDEAFGYDGEDFLTLDLKNMRWIAPVTKALQTKNKWDSTERPYFRSNYFNNTCVEWLKKYVYYERSTLGGKVHPSVSVFWNSYSSSAVCHATGFYPDSVMITWKRDGEELFDDTDVRETLPNMDGTFQKRVVLHVSLEESKKGMFTCEVVPWRGEPIVKTLIVEDSLILPIIIACVVGVLVILCVIVAFVMKKKKKRYMRAEHYEMTAQSDDCEDSIRWRY